MCFIQINPRPATCNSPCVSKALRKKHDLVRTYRNQALKRATSEEDESIAIFYILPAEMRGEIFNKLIEQKEWKTLIRASDVNWQWKSEIETLWRGYCEKNKMILDENTWARWPGKNWRWLCMCLTRVFDKEELKEGYGTTASTPNEAKYEGEFKENKKNGVGRIWWSNGDRYLGEWKNDSKDGFGFMMWENGDKYEGTWKNDLRDGDKAKYIYANGGIYDGNYLNDERHGTGAYIWPDGDQFHGAWKSGGRTGKGVLVLKDGSRVDQEWNESPYVNYSDSLPPKYPPNQAPFSA